MKVFKFLLNIGLLALVGSALATISGCQEGQKQVLPSEPVFYPGPPDKPRLQFLISISGSDDLGAPDVGGFEKFIVGKDESKAITIAKPFGLAIDDGKLYVCDVGRRFVDVLDLKAHTFGYLTRERRMSNPVDIFIDGGRKYVADSVGGGVFVFGNDNQLVNVLGKDLGLKPVDVVVRGQKCYVADVANNQVVVLDKTTGAEMLRMGKRGNQEGELALIAGLAVDPQGNVFVTDKAMARVTKFNKDGTFERTIGKMGDSIYDFVRPKGIDIDREGRIWVVDTAPEVVKIYNSEGQLLMFFGFPGGEPGNMNMPASVVVDYENIDLFSEYFTEGAQIEFLVLVSNQFGAKINIYGFGSFPVQEAELEKAKAQE